MCILPNQIALFTAVKPTKQLKLLQIVYITKSIIPQSIVLFNEKSKKILCFFKIFKLKNYIVLIILQLEKIILILPK